MEEGADMLMVKPGIFYLDIIAKIKQRHPHHPLFAYQVFTSHPFKLIHCNYQAFRMSPISKSQLQVSGEYSMLVRGAEAGLFNLDAAIMEAFRSFRRAGTDVIISYFTPRVLENIRNLKQ